MYVRIRDGEVADVRAARSTSRRASSRRSCAAARYTEAPDITARICGICPVAYQMSAVHGDGGRAAASTVDEPIRDAAPAALLRRVDREPRPARLHAARARLPRLRERDRDGRATTARSSSAGCALKKAGNELIARRSAAARSTRSTCASAASTARRRGASCAPLRRAAASGRASSRWRPCAGRRRCRSPTSSATTSSSRCAQRGEYPIERGRLVSSRGLDIAPARVRRALRGGAGRSTRTRCTRACAARRLPRRPAGALQPELRRGCRRWRARRRARPASAPVCRNPFQSIVVRAVEIAVRLRRGAADHRRLRAARPPAVELEPRAGVGYGWHRGAARHALPPLRARRRRARSSTPRSCRRPRRTRRRSRRTCGRSSRRLRRARRRGAARCAASRRSATTTRASPARRTSSTLEVERS